MEPGSIHIRYTGVWLFAIFIFFFNSFLLPLGLTYALLLMPLWLYFIYKEKQTTLAITILIPLLLYAVIHLIQGVHLQYYLVSITMICGVIFFIIATYSFINKGGINWDIIFKDIAILNFILAIASIPLLYISGLKPIVWYLIPLTDGIGIIPRLKLFMPEASHYSFLLAPVAIYFFSRTIFFKTRNSFLTLFIIAVPLLMSFSLGVLSCLIFTGILIVVLFWKRVFSSKRQIRIILSFMLLGVLVFCAAYFLYPTNALFQRIHNIFAGNDTSARGRTYEAFILANKIIAGKSYWWGIGPGQLKLFGRQIVIVYYLYAKVPEVIRIPNACAETIVYFGYSGFVIRMCTEIFFFIKTKVFNNPYRLWLFLFVFIYQFTGSYITNIQEYIIWILVFSPILPEYIKSNKNLSLGKSGITA